MEFHLAIPQDNAYARTHPLTGQRISVLESMYQKDPAWDTPTDPALEARFQRIKAKLAGYVLDPKQTLIRYPESDQSIRSEEHTSELQSLMRISYAVFCLKKQYNDN